MAVIGILLIALGITGIVMGNMMFGDISIACFVAAAAALLSGIGFLIAAGKIAKLKKTLKEKRPSGQ